MKEGLDVSTNRSEKRKGKKKVNKRRRVVLISLISLLFIILFGVSFYISHTLNKVNKTIISDKPEDIGIDPKVEQKLVEEGKADDAINIALFGLDSRDPKEAGSRSDSIMILSIDKAHKKIKLSSIMRDSYVNIKDHGTDKITHAYAFGGPQLAVRTLNENFDMNIKDFVTVNFFSMEKIINTLGGVQIDVKKDEIAVMNDYITELSAIEGIHNPPYLKNPGKQSLNGMQAVAYTRDRYSGGGDFDRTERQRTILSALFDKIQSSGPLKYPQIVSDLLPYVTTSLSQVDMIKLGTEVMSQGVKALEQERFPLDGYCEGKTINSIWYLVFDKDATKDQLHKFIYDDIKPTPGKPKF